MRVYEVGCENRYGRQKKYSYQPVFGRLFEEHMSWGANYIKEKGTTNFKLFSFPDAKAVLLEVTKNAKVKFSNWWNRAVNIKEPDELATATTAAAIASISALDEESSLFPMEPKGEGIYEINGVDAKPGDGYRYVVVQKDGTVHTVKDPYSKEQKNKEKTQEELKEILQKH